jgi:quinoprotein glucose dehydrogenase
MSGCKIVMLTIVLGCLTTAISTMAAAQSSNSGGDWPYYGHDAGTTRYSPLSQINRTNISKLKVAWTFHTGDISDGSHGRRRSGFETTPLMVDGKLYLTTPFNRVIALDPSTGKQIWAYDPKIDQTWQAGDGLINRGVAQWLDPKVEKGRPCRRRIFEATIDARLIAIDSNTGKPCSDFGNMGEVSLRNVNNFRSGWYHMTSPPAVIDDLVVVGSAIDDNARADMPTGVVRAFDARTGAVRWSWDPIPPNQENSDKTKAWRSGAANAWSMMSVDPERDLVFIPTGSASPDYYGGLRPGDNKWANSVVALRAKTGKMAWGFQLVHHDLWDYDSAAAPLLTAIRHAGKTVPVVIQGNKTGFLYVLDRDSGTPVFPIEERPVPKSDVPGEAASPTQPFPQIPPALTPQQVSPNEAWGISPKDRETCRKWLQESKTQGIFTPPALQETLAVPGNIGGINWSGYAFDSQNGLLIVNTTNLPFRVKLIPTAKYNEASILGGGEYAPQTGAPYGMFRAPLLSPSGLPCTAPPWGLLTAVDMNDGKIKWQVPLGSMSEFPSGHRDVPPGSLSLGGPIVTAGGLVFIGGTLDPYIRAFDVQSGLEIWKARLPASGHAAPMTYEVNGKQYVVIAAGGHSKITEEPQSDALVAFALP